MNLVLYLENKRGNIKADGLMTPGGETEAHTQDNLPEKSPTFPCV